MRIMYLKPQKYGLLSQRVPKGPKGHWASASKIAGCGRPRLRSRPSEAHLLIIGNVPAPSGEALRLGLLLHAAPLSGGSCCMGSGCELHDGLLPSASAEECFFAFSSMLPMMNHLLSGRISSATSSPSTALFWATCPCRHAHSHLEAHRPISFVSTPAEGVICCLRQYFRSKVLRNLGTVCQRRCISTMLTS